MSRRIYVRRVVQEEIMILVEDGETEKEAMARVLSFGRAQVPWLPLHETCYTIVGDEKVTLDFIPPNQALSVFRAPPYNPTESLPRR